MFLSIDKLEEEEPPTSRAAAVAGRVSQTILLILCASPAALFALALAHRAIRFLLD
jgi:hypothetical protein